jgi:hypothetical protein
MNKHAMVETRACGHCTKPFRAVADQWGANAAVYCSPGCKLAARRERRKVVIARRKGRLKAA